MNYIGYNSGFGVKACFLTGVNTEDDLKNESITRSFNLKQEVEIASLTELLRKNKPGLETVTFNSQISMHIVLKPVEISEMASDFSFGSDEREYSRPLDNFFQHCIQKRQSIHNKKVCKWEN